MGMFTDKMIRGLKHPTSGQRDVWESGKIKGFGIRVGKETKTFFVGVRVNGKYRRISIGQYDEGGLAGVSLKEARDKAYQIVGDAHAGIGPEARKKREEKGTFGAVAAAFMQDYASKKRTRGEMQRMINHDLTEWHDRQIAEITRSEIKELLRVKARTAPIMANRIKALVSKMFTWALKEEIIDSSPALSLDPPGGSEEDRQRTRKLGADEIRLVWNSFDREGYPFGPLFKMLLVTGQRRGEVAGMKWSEIEEDGWHVPNERAKSGKGHLVPLSSLAREIIANLPQFGEHVFRSSKLDRPPQGWSQAKRRVNTNIPAWRLHDLRRTFATHLRSLGVDRLVVSKLLNHAEAGVTKIYDRYVADPEKTAAMERWANRLREIISGAPASNVIQMSPQSA
jgi:integrase